MDNLVISPVAPVAVATGPSRPDDPARRWAAEHARLTGAPVEPHPPDRTGPLPDARLLVIAQDGSGPTSVHPHVLALADHATCDVVVVRGGTSPAHHRITALITGIGDDPVLGRAAVLADQRGAALRVLYACPPLPVRADAPEWPLAHADDVLRGVRHTSVLARMHPHEAITRYADTDILVVAGSGPTTRAALHHARCPVFIARHCPPDPRRGQVPLPRRPEGSGR
ncbi:universal stress protein [Actinosynnema sp. NPDC047251]|nr:universal stress protein [Saccharothrix espanaensis]